MNHAYEMMERLFTCPPQELMDESLALHLDWRIRYAVAVLIGDRQVAEGLPILEKMLDLEMKRPLYSQPKTAYIGVEGDTSLAEQVKPFTVVFPYEVDEETQEAWKCRGRVKQAICFAIYAIGQAPPSLVDTLKQMVINDQEDAPVRSAAVRALSQVGDASCIPACAYAQTIDEWCIRKEAEKALEVLQK